MKLRDRITVSPVLVFGSMVVAGQRSAQVARNIFNILSRSFLWNHISWVGAPDKKRPTEKQVWQASASPPSSAQRCSVWDQTQNRSLIKRYITAEQMLSVTPSSNLWLLSDTGGMDAKSPGAIEGRFAWEQICFSFHGVWHSSHKACLNMVLDTEECWKMETLTELTPSIKFLLVFFLLVLSDFRIILICLVFQSLKISMECWDWQLIFSDHGDEWRHIKALLVFILGGNWEAVFSLSMAEPWLSVSSCDRFIAGEWTRPCVLFVFVKRGKGDLTTRSTDFSGGKMKNVGTQDRPLHPRR